MKQHVPRVHIYFHPYQAGHGTWHHMSIHESQEQSKREDSSFHQVNNETKTVLIIILSTKSIKNLVNRSVQNQ